MSRVWRYAPVYELTAVDDGRSHRVTADAYTAGLMARTGRYTTLCGRVVLGDAMTTAPGPPCRPCRDAERAVVQ